MKKTIQNFKKTCIAQIIVVVLFLIPISTAHALTLTPIRLELSGDPGQTLSEHITLINERKTTETFYVSYENFEAQGETGDPTWYTPQDDLGTWMNSDASVTLGPGEQKNVPFTITIPTNAEAGGHFAGIFWGTTPQVQPGGQVAIGAKTGVLVLLSVSGAVSEKGGILEFTEQNAKHFFTALPIDFYYRFQNSGSDRIKPAGDMTIKNMIGLTTAKLPGNPIDGNILPKSIRKIALTWKSDSGATSTDGELSTNFFTQAAYEWHNFAFGRYTIDLNLTYGTSNEAANATYSLWVFPWQLILLVLLTLSLIILILRGALRRYNKWVIGRAEKMFEEHEAQMHHIKKKAVLHKVVGPKVKKK